MWKLFFRIERIKAVRIVIDNSIATPFHIIIIDDTVLSILQTYSRFQENSLISFNNYISSVQYSSFWKHYARSSRVIRNISADDSTVSPDYSERSTRPEMDERRVFG